MRLVDFVFADEPGPIGQEAVHCRPSVCGGASSDGPASEPEKPMSSALGVSPTRRPRRRSWSNLTSGA